MNYREELLKRVEDSENWPVFDNGDFLEKLNELADNFFDKKTIEGFLASLVVYHQLIEELAKCLINCSDFLIQCSIFPQEISKKHRERRMFGELLEELKNGIVDQDIKKFIQKCEDFNKIRINVVHKLTLKKSFKDIEGEVKLSKRHFDEIYLLFEKIYDDYRISFSYYKKNIGDLREL